MIYERQRIDWLHIEREFLGHFDLESIAPIDHSIPQPDSLLVDKFKELFLTDCRELVRYEKFCKNLNQAQ